MQIGYSGYECAGCGAKVNVMMQSVSIGRVLPTGFLCECCKGWNKITHVNNTPWNGNEVVQTVGGSKDGTPYTTGGVILKRGI